MWYSDWSILLVQPSPHEELNRSVTLSRLPPPLEFESSYFLRSKIFRQVTQLQIRIPRPSLSEGSLQCRWLDSQAEFRIVLEHLWESFLNLRCTFIRAYNLHCNTYILSLSFNLFSFGLWRGEGVMQSTCRQPATEGSENLEVVTLHRRSDSKRTYRPQAFF